MLEKLYEEVLVENKAIEWIKDHAEAVKDAFISFTDKHGGIGRTAASMAGAAMVATSPVVMAAYFHKFFQQHPETLMIPDKILQYIAQFLANNPQILELIKR
jgi:hypothetical protein